MNNIGLSLQLHQILDFTQSIKLNAISVIECVHLGLLHRHELLLSLLNNLVFEFVVFREDLMQIAENFKRLLALRVLLLGIVVYKFNLGAFLLNARDEVHELVVECSTCLLGKQIHTFEDG